MRTTACLVLLASSAFAGDVHRVDPTDPSAFAKIGDAVAAAAPGDVIVVSPKPEFPGIFFTGLYPPFTVDKSLTIVAEEGELVRSKTATIRDLGPDEHVVLRGIQFERAMPAQGAVNLRVENHQGSVWLEDCVFRISTEIFQPLVSVPAVHSDPAVEILGPAAPPYGAVTFARCRIDGTDGATDFSLGPSYGFQMNAGIGLRVERSLVGLWDSEVRGGKGQPGSPVYGLSGGNGGIAVRVDDGYVFASSTALSGGAGGYGFPADGSIPCVDGGDGGHGIVVLSGGVEAIGAAFTGGAPGFPGGTCPGGATGKPALPAGIVSDLGGAPFHLTADAPKREDEMLHLEVGGPAQALFVIGLDLDPLFQVSTSGGLIRGLLHVDPGPVVPVHPALVGQLGPDGAVIDLPLTGALGPMQGATVFLQAVGLDVAAGGAWTTSSPSAFVLLAAGL